MTRLEPSSMSIVNDGIYLRKSWNAALNDAQTQLQSHLTSASSPLWRRIPPVAHETLPDGSTNPSEESQVIIHKRPSKHGEIFRLVYDIPAQEFSISAWKAVLATPEIRQEWDPAVESSQLVEIFDVDVRIAKTYFTLGWPANPRDAITISRTLSDGATLLDVTTSLPRSPDEPPYLRPTPPYVRSQVHLFAWVIQQVPSSPEPKVRLTCFWQHDLKAVWGMGMPSRANHLCSLMIGAVKAVNKFGNFIPMLQGFGLGVGIDRMVFDVGRKSLTIDYSIVDEQEDDEIRQAPKGMDDIRAKKERRRLEKSIEFVLPKLSSWDVQMITRASSSPAAATPWTVNVYRDTDIAHEQDQLLLRTRHAPLPSSHAIVKVKLVIEASAGPAGLLRLNGTPHPIENLEARDPTLMMIPEQLLQDASNTGALSFQTPFSGQAPFSDDVSRTMSTRILAGGRTESSQKSILKLVRRNYVYFASLLQEPEVKWKPLVEARGVAVTQLDSIDPTLVVYRAEAVFVGVSVWDLISVISSPGATIHWDKGFDSANLLEDVSELSQLWHYKTRAAWPVNARESVLLRSTYKSPSSVHVFSFSTDDSQLFPGIPSADPSVIRTQVDLRGWAIEALSPNTTQVTLIEQSDPKGWSNKASLPQQIIAAVSGVGDFVIKCGGPPILSRLGGARALVNRYDHEKALFRLEYEGDVSRGASIQAQSSTPAGSVLDLSEALFSPTVQARPFIECELRCDIEVWGGPIEIMVDPPPQTVSCLRRHRLSDNGGGLWVTIEHDADFVLGERLRVVVRKGITSSAKDRGSVLINGAKARVEVQDMPEAEIKLLAKRKRVKPVRIPLDQPPVVGVIQRRRAEWAADAESSQVPEDNASIGILAPKPTTSVILGNTFGRLMTLAVSQAASSTTSAMSAVAKPFALTEQSVPTSNKLPMQHALDALSYLRTLYTRPTQEGWLQVNETAGLAVFKKLETEISRTIPVHKASKVIEGVAAEEMVNVLSSFDCRRQWDDRFDSAVVLQDYGHGCQTAFTTIKGAFPFQPRGFYTASVLGCSSNAVAPLTDTRPGTGLLTPRADNGHATYYLATSSFNPESAADFSPNKYNPFGYAVGRVLVRGWICETLDPYTEENYAIPSTRCTFVTAVDFAGAVPVAYNSMLNASLPRAILRLESYLKMASSLPFCHQPGVGLAIEPNEGPQEGWSFERRDRGTLLLGRTFDFDAKEFKAIFFTPVTPRQVPPSSDDITPTPSGFIGSQRPSTPSHGDSYPRQRTASLSPPGGYDFPRSHSPESERLRPNTVGRTNPLAPASQSKARRPLISSSTQNDITPTDLVAAEVIVDATLYPEGFTVIPSSQLRIPEEFLDISHPPERTSDDLHVITTIFALPATLFKSSHSERSGSRYLVRLTIPTARYETPSIEDPLAGQTRTVPPRPNWLLELMEKGGAVGIIIKPAPQSSTPTSSTSPGFRVFIGETLAEILSERKSLAILGKLEVDTVSQLPWVSRSNNAILPGPLSVPVAIAKDRLADVQPEKELTKAEKSSIPEPPFLTAAMDEEAPLGAIEAPSRPGLIGFLDYTSWWPKKVPEVPILKSNPAAKGDEPVVVTGEVQALIPDDKDKQLTVTLLQARRHAISIPTAILIGFICFLLGSLFRSLLSPTDFVIVKSAGDAYMDEHVDWRRLTRLVELKLSLTSDLIIGIVHA